jgi:hypothetical protein
MSEQDIDISSLLRNPEKIHLLHSGYEQIVGTKEDYRQNWNSFLQSIRESQAAGRIKDMEFSTERHSFKAVVTLLDHKEALIFCATMLGKFVGLYYAVTDSRQAYLPVVDYRKGGVERHLSYYPFSEEQETLGRLVVQTALDCFPGFRKFDNYYAGVPVANITIGQMQHAKLDLFQALFCTNVHGLI